MLIHRAIGGGVPVMLDIYGRIAVGPAVWQESLNAALVKGAD